jgi:DNA-binding NarL/FixJ family response regulator
MIKIAIADDHPMITDGLRLILSMHQHILLENTYSNGTELMSGMQIKQPDVLLLDIQFPETTGDHLLPLLLKTYPDLRILVLTGIDSALYIHNMLRDGARGYVLKNSASAVIVTAIETVYRGEIYLEDTLQRKLELFKDKIKYFKIYPKRIYPAANVGSNVFRPAHCGILPVQPLSKIRCQKYG